ncbi:MAG TPA: adenylate kinase [Candidatus Gastranaerophilales bacterium]|nr:adenylate kinase [Candidatus Gastranaerophilales bacterium]
MKKRMIFLGPPGSGKGTQADKVAEAAEIPHIDTGGMLREEIAAGTEEGKTAEKYMSQGQLAPAELVIRIVKNRLSRPDTKNGFILDGFPRSIQQAEGLDEILEGLNEKIDFVFNIDLDESVLIDRMAYRRSCKDCGYKFNLKFNPPTVDGVCSICEGELVQRSDDNVETATKRIDTYKKETAPLIEYYTKKGIITNIDGDKEIYDIFNEIAEILDLKIPSV